MSRLVRVLIYEGDEDALRAHFGRIQQGPVALNTCAEFGDYSVSSVIAEVENVPCLVCDKLTNNTVLICEDCRKKSEIFAQEAVF